VLHELNQAGLHSLLRSILRMLNDHRDNIIFHKPIPRPRYASNTRPANLTLVVSSVFSYGAHHGKKLPPPSLSRRSRVHLERSRSTSRYHSISVWIRRHIFPPVCNRSLSYHIIQPPHSWSVSSRRYRSSSAQEELYHSLVSALEGYLQWRTSKTWIFELRPVCLPIYICTSI
jgi:hypothetical protein